MSDLPFLFDEEAKSQHNKSRLAELERRPVFPNAPRAPRREPKPAEPCPACKQWLCLCSDEELAETDALTAPVRTIDPYADCYESEAERDARRHDSDEWREWDYTRPVL